MRFTELLWGFFSVRFLFISFLYSLETISTILSPLLLALFALTFFFARKSELLVKNEAENFQGLKVQKPFFGGKQK